MKYYFITFSAFLLKIRALTSHAKLLSFLFQSEAECVLVPRAGITWKHLAFRRVSLNQKQPPGTSAHTLQSPTGQYSQHHMLLFSSRH